MVIIWSLAYVGIHWVPQTMALWQTKQNKFTSIFGWDKPKVYLIPADRGSILPQHLPTARKSLSYLPNPSARAGYDTRSIFFKRNLTGLNSEFSFS